MALRDVKHSRVEFTGQPIGDEMSKHAIHDADKLVSTGSYSSAVVIDGWVFVSGHASLDPRTGEVISASIEQETRRTLEQIGRLLAQIGCGMDDVVRCGCHLANINDFESFDRVYAEFFPGVKPSRTTVQSVLWGGLKVEIDAIAKLPQTVGD
jgi:2-iminobutanoate/2-iminopropanoate deaminase